MDPDLNRDDSRIERLKRGLYSRKTPDFIDENKKELLKKGLDSPLPVGWQAPSENRFDVLASRVSHGAEKHHSIAKKVLIISTIFFLVSVAVAGFAFFGGFNTISAKNVDIKVVGPVSVAGGQEATFDIVVVNKNNSDLGGAKLTVEYPKGIRAPDDLSKELTSQTFELGDIKSGSQGTQKLDLFIFGEKEEVKTFNISVEYKVKNSSATFYKEKAHEITISSSPVIITATYPKEVNSGQDITFSIEVASNSKDTIKDFLVNIQYPFGFNFSKSSPSASYANDSWLLSNLKSGEKRTINIEGSVMGQDNEERVFKINAGTASLSDERKIGVLFAVLDESILVKKPFLGLDIKIGGSKGDYVSGGGEIGGSIDVHNNLPDRIFNIVVEAALSGNAFSKNAVTVSQNGFFRSIDNTISWDKRAVEEFTDFAPSQAKSLSFRLTPLSYQNIAGGATPEIKISVRATGERILSSGAVEKVESLGERVIKLSTSIALTPRLTRSYGSIENSGPIPPKADKPTTYTVVWTLTNSFNTAGNVVARAVLPQYVKWTGQYLPRVENISFNTATNEVIWNAGQVPAGAGYSSSPREVTFQISFLPSVSQVGKEPELVGGVSLSGLDKTTNTTLEYNAPALTTRFGSDPTYKIGNETVMP